MKNIIDTICYNEHFTERVLTQVFPIYELWSISPLGHKEKVLISGSTEETVKFSGFIEKHVNKDYPFDLMIIVANGEKNYPTIMLNTSKKAIKVRFDHINPDGIGTPLIMPGYTPNQW